MTEPELTQADMAALEIGRLFMRVHSAEQYTTALAKQLAEKEAQLAKLIKEVEDSDRPRTGRRKRPSNK